MPFSIRHVCSQSSCPFVAIGGEAKQSSTSLSTVLHFLHSGISSQTVRGAFQNSNSYSVHETDYRRSLSWRFKERSLDNTGQQRTSYTRLSLLCPLATELNHDLGTAENMDYKVNRWTRGQYREKFLFSRGFSFSCDSIEDLHGLCSIQLKNETKLNQLQHTYKLAVSLQYKLSPVL